MRVKLSSLSTWQKVQLLRRELSRECLEREYHIDALIALMISKQHGLLLGPPGTGKSMLLELMCESFSGKYFSMLVSENSKPDEFFGPVSISSLKDKEVYKRNTQSKLPEAQIAYLDEIFKTSSATLNQLLKLINERIFYNPDAVKVPLITLVGSSNELPQDDAASAFVDRFVWKSWVAYMQDRSNIATLWQRSLDGHKSKINVRLSQSDLEAASVESKQVDIKSQHPLLITLKQKLEEAGYQVSDRKWLMILKFMQVFAWVRNEQSVTIETIKLLLPDCLWQQPEQQQAIAQKIDAIIEGFSIEINSIKEALDHHNKAFHIINTSDNVGLDSWNASAIDVIDRLDNHLKRIDALEAEGAPTELLLEVKLSIQKSINHIKSVIQDANSSQDDRRRKKAQESIEAVTHRAQINVSQWRRSFDSLSLDHWNQEAANLASFIKNAIAAIQDTSNAESSVVNQAVKQLKEHLVSIRQEVSLRNDLEMPTR